MPSSFEGTFEQSRKEWTIRKHGILTHYFHVASAMLKDAGNRLAFVDGFAGANQYEEEESGSTRIMIEVGIKAHEQWDTQIQIHACESNIDTFNQMCVNLREHIDSGILHVYNLSHAEVAEEIQEQTRGWPTIVFLDPNRPIQMTIEDDIVPWAGRPYTDILGLCFGQSVLRIVTSAKKVEATQKTAAVVAGEDWEEIGSEEQAYDQFLDRIKCLLPNGYAGMYRLWKRDVNRIAYGLFGITSNINGYWLLSDAVARDHSRLAEFKNKGAQESLFDDDPEYNENLRRFNHLTEASKPYVMADAKVNGKKLGKLVLEAHRDEFFGQYAEKDFNRVIREIKKTVSEGSNNA